MNNTQTEIVVIGAGAAGLVAAATAANHGARVVLLEKNRKTGVKILMSGGTRCNLTHDTNSRGITEAFGHAKRFLQYAVGSFSPSDVVKMFNDLGVATKIEPTGKIFPASNRAVHVRDALHRATVESGAEIRLDSGVQSVAPIDDRWRVETESGPIEAERVIVTAGGKSWPGCGTTGDAYSWLQTLGHSIVTPRPALVPLVGGHAWMNDLSGVTLPDTIARVTPTARAKAKGKKAKPLIERRSSMLLTHFGFSGPAAMDVSGHLTAADSFSEVKLQVDLVPEISRPELESFFADRSGDRGRRNVSTALNEWIPSRLANSVVQQSGGDCTLSQLSKSQSQQLCEHLKSLHLPISGTRGFKKAEVTAGGVALSEVDPKTMASRKAKGLYIAGEVLDVDGWIGGYNFQAAFSTGRLAGISATSSLTPT